jgi:hypothetical protein
MSRITVHDAETNRDVQVALSTEPDYSMTFTQDVISLHRVIADTLSAPVEHDDDMNYSSAQKLVVWLDKRCHFLAPRSPKAVYRLIDFVSSRGHFFTFITLGLSASTAGWKEKGLEEPKRYWSLVAKDKLPDGIKSFQKRIASIMELKGYTLLVDTVLSQEAAGHLTKLDGRPATVFEVLFSEIY